MSIIRLLIAVGTKYKIHFFFNLVAICMSSFLLMIIFTFNSYYSFYHAIDFGFIPDAHVEFKKLLGESEMDILIKNLKTFCRVNYAQKGRLLRQNNVSFLLDSNDIKRGETIGKNIAIVGLSFDGDNHVTVTQQGKKFICEVLNIDHFGYWYIYITKNKRLREGKCQLKVKQHEVELLLFEEPDFMRLEFDESGYPGNDPEKLAHYRLFYSFLNDFINRFMDLNSAGININRYAADSNKNELINEFETYQYRKLQAYASLIFGEFHNQIPLLVSRKLKKSLNQFQGAAMIQVMMPELKLEAQMIDELNYDPEAYLDKNLLLTGYGSLRKFLGTNEGYNVLYLYGSRVAAGDIGAYISKKYPDSTCISKYQVIPGIGKQKKYIEIFIYSLHGLLSLFLFTIIGINLLNFYNLFRNEVALLKLHGFNIPVYSLFILVLMIFGFISSWVMMAYFIRFNNDILAQYFYPSISLTKEPIIVGISLFFIIVFILLLEIFQQKKVLRTEKENFNEYNM